MKKTIIFIIIMVLTAVNVFAFDFAQLSTTFLNQDPDPAEPGKYVELRWKVVKLGNNVLKNITYEIEMDYPFSLDPGESSKKNLGNWKGDSKAEEYYTLYYKVRVDDDALEDVYKIKLKSNFDNTNSWTIYEYDIRVSEKKNAKFVLGTLVTDPVKLTSDTVDSELKIELENIGDGNAENVKATLILPEGFSPTYSYSDQKNLGTIEEGEGKSAIFYIDIDENVKGGDHASKVIINYKDANDGENEYKTVELPIVFQVKNKPKFEITNIVTEPAEVFPNMDVLIKLTVKNVGDEEGKSVSLRAFKESSQPFDFQEKSDFIGKLAPGESGEGMIKLKVEENANPKDYLMDIEIRAIQDDQVLIQEKTTTLTINEATTDDIDALIQARKQANPLVRWGIPALLSVIFGVIGFSLGKRKHKK